MIRPGLCSVTFRALPVEDVVRHAANAGLECIEWAGDAHVPAGDTTSAEAARRLTEEAGLAVASYGSYLAFEGTDEDVRDQAAAVLGTARALGAPRIRVWAGRTGSAEVDPEHRAVLVARIRDLSDEAREHGIEIGLEFHGGTLTDDVDSTLRLLGEIGREDVRSYWQPPQDMESAAALGTLRTVLPAASTIHVFSWWPNHRRHPLGARDDLWRLAFGILEDEGSDRDALLEFIPDDDPSLLAREAGTLRTLLAEGRENAR